MRHLTLILTLILLLACAPLALAGEPPVPIEGKMLVCGWDISLGASDFAYFMEGSSDNIIPAPPAFVDGDMSPHANQVAYVVEDGLWPFYLSDIWKADIDGSNPVDVTGPLGPGGINCNPRWSPDASMITFQHCDLPGPGEEGLVPCERGFEVWVINSDGMNPHRVTAEGTFQGEEDPRWSANGYRILFGTRPWSGLYTIDIDGTDLAQVSAGGAEADWSPDGSQIASSTWLSDVVDDEPGVWRQLLLTDADGSNPQVLVEHFISDADVQAHLDHIGPQYPPGEDSFNDIQCWVGPARPEWSPLGDRIVFTAAMPFDPYGSHFFAQDDLWVYELGTGDLTKITDDPLTEGWLSWNGDNTYPYDPEVTVDNTTVTFSEVTGDGLTTIIRDDDPPEMPTGYDFAGEFYEISTTAETSGPISICVTYRDEDIPTGVAEEDLCILHWYEAEQVWVDITTSRDPDNNAVCGETYVLSAFVLYAGPSQARFPDVPITGFGPEEADPHWALDEINACVDAGIVGGYPDGFYYPDYAVSRDQMAVFISRALAGGDDNVQDGPAEATFEDVPTDHWSFDYVEYCVVTGVVQGFDPVTYGPTVTVSRDSMAVFISRAIAGGDDNVPDGPADATFDDVPTDHWAYKYVEYCAAEGIVHGYDPVTYGPTVTVSRDQMAVFISRAFQLP